MRAHVCRWLCAWFLLVSVSPLMGHAHEGGEAAHAHGTASNRDDPIDSLADSGRHAWHWHLVLLGFEIHIPSSSPVGESAPPSDEASPLAVSLNAACEGDSFAPAAFPLDCTLAGPISEPVKLPAAPGDAPCARSHLPPAPMLRSAILLV